jgi:DNA replication protein DnaC
MSALARSDVLVLDDFLLRSLSDDHAADLLEVVEDRTNKSTIITSQLPISHWHEGLGDPTVADAILDRLLEQAHRIELIGESRRRAKQMTAENHDN